MRFGHLTEYNVRNMFFQKLCKKLGSGTSWRPLFTFLESFI